MSLVDWVVGGRYLLAPESPEASQPARGECNPLIYYLVIVCYCYCFPIICYHLVWSLSTICYHLLLNDWRHRSHLGASVTRWYPPWYWLFLFCYHLLAITINYNRYCQLFVIICLSNHPRHPCPLQAIVTRWYPTLVISSPCLSMMTFLIKLSAGVTNFLLAGHLLLRKVSSKPLSWAFQA